MTIMILSQEYEKDRTVQHNKRKATHHKITSPAMMDICEAEWPYDASLIDMKEGVNDRKDDKNKIYDEEKEAKWPDDTSPVDIEEGVSDIKYDNNEENDEEKGSEWPDETSPVDMEEGVSDRKYDKNKNDKEKEA